MILLQLSGMCDHWDGQSQFELRGEQKVSFSTNCNDMVGNYQYSQFWKEKCFMDDEKVAGAWTDMAADQDVPLQADHYQPGQDDDDDDDDHYHYQEVTLQADDHQPGHLHVQN